jgi:TetR/AcrR family transcriptional regulator
MVTDTGDGVLKDPGDTSMRESGRRRERRPRGQHAAALRTAARGLIEQQGTAFTTQEVIREAGVSLQTFYRYYDGKDRLLLAVIAEMIEEHCARLADAARPLRDPVDRLRLYISGTLDVLGLPDGLPGAQFITSEHWRLHQLYPREVSEAVRPFTDLLRGEIEAAREDGSLAPRHPERDAWLVARTVMGAYHHYAFSPDDPTIATAAWDVWSYCYAGLGGAGPAPRDRRRRPAEHRSAPPRT